MSGQHILVIDDNELNAKLLLHVLTAAGYVVSVAATADAALAALERELPSLILMDLQLPGMDGLVLTKQLKADPRTRDTLIVACTAYAMLGDETRAFEAGCDGYVTKPIDVRTLPAQLAGYLATRGAEPTSE